MGIANLLAGQRSDPQNRKERAKAAAEAEQPDHEKYTGTTDGTPVGQPVGATVNAETFRSINQ